MECAICKRQPGKFEGSNGALEYFFYDAMLNGGGDDTTGGENESPITEWLQIQNHDIADLRSMHARDTDGWHFCQEHCRQAALELKDAYGVSIFEDSNGFVHVSVYDHEHTYDSARDAS